MTSIIDRIKSMNLAKLAIDYLIMLYPKRSFAGILLGMLLIIFHSVFLPTLEQLQRLDLAGLSWWLLMILGFTVGHIRTIIESFTEKSQFPSEIEHILSATRRLAHEGKLSKKQRQIVYLSAVRKVQEMMINEADKMYENEEAKLINQESVQLDE